MTGSAHATTESSVDALRRRARRRLLGAVVLAFSAAIALPLVFEKEPPPLPDEVDIRIPPVDKTPFTTKPAAPATSKAPSVETAALATQAAAGAAGLSGATPPAVPSPAALPPTGAEATPATTPRAEPATTAAKPDRTDPSKSDGKPTTDAKSAVAVDAKSEPKAEGKAISPTANADPDGPKTAPKAGDFVVQLIAVRDEASALKVLERARRAGYKTAYREKIHVVNGIVTRVRTGPYKDRATAERIRNKLAAEGFEAVVVAIK